MKSLAIIITLFFSMNAKAIDCSTILIQTPSDAEAYTYKVLSEISLGGLEITRTALLGGRGRQQTLFHADLMVAP